MALAIEEQVEADQVRITVVPAAAHPDVLSVQDAMRQVLDFFELLTPESSEGFFWNLRIATTNSPLTVGGEPYSLKADLDVRAIAFEQKSILEESFRALSEGRRPRQRLSSRRRDTLRRIFHRNMNGIGKTEAVLFAAEEPVFVTPKVAALSVKTLELEEPTDFQSLFLKERARSEMGSIEGYLVEAGRDYNAPSVLIEERNTGQEIWCRLVGDCKDQVSSITSLNDVWARCRVMVRGRITYSSDGTITRIWANDLALIKPREVTVDGLFDPDFTSSDKTIDYLERLREGGLG